MISSPARGLSGFDPGRLAERVAPDFERAHRSTACAKPGPPPGRTIIGAASGAKDHLAVRVLHERLLGKALWIGEEAVREKRNLRYIRGIDAAVKEARTRSAQMAEAHVRGASGGALRPDGL